KLSGFATAQLTVTEPVNEEPVANAGTDQFVIPNIPIQLDGSKSTDPEGEALTYAWTFKSRPAGSQAKFSDESAQKPTFVGDVEGRYVIELVVKDKGDKLSKPDSVTIQVSIGADKTPVLNTISPTEGWSYELKFKVVLEGKDFVKGAKVRIKERDFDTTYVSDQKLEATVNLALVGAGEHPVKIINTNGKESGTVTFKVKDLPAPRIINLNPEAGHIGTQLVVTVTGDNFIKDRSEVSFQSVPLLTKVISAKELTFNLDLRNTTLGSYPVKITNPGNRSSKEVMFRVLDTLPKPTLNVLNPPSGVTGTKIAFSMHGVGFGEGAKIFFDNNPIPSKRIRRDEVAAFPSLDLTNIAPGEYDVWIVNPDGQSTNKEKFR
ncbi:MAG: IPT/TIG domain-containing protein, partial [Bdellovibrionales bacterium]|nr:IPT/TIG domain-containing protein [Bdellovibrionales bacterium]